VKRTKGGQLNSTLFSLLYGQGKLRKTTAALMVPPEFRPVAYLDCDNGAAIRLKVLSMTAEERKARAIIENVPATCGPWMQEGIEFFYPEKPYYADCFAFATQLSKDFKTVIVDTMSRMADGILDEVKNTNYGAVSKRVTIGSGALATVHPVPADYGMAQDRVMELLSALDHNEAHLLLISHEKAGEIKEGDVVKRTLAGPRSAGNALLEVIPSIVDVALRLTTKSSFVDGKMVNKVIVRSQNHEIFLAGDRSGLFPDNEEFDPALMWERFGRFTKMTAPPSKGE